MANVTFDDEFNSLSSTWQPTWPWSPNGTAVGSGWFANPSQLPGDANPISINNGALDLANFPVPGDVSSSQIGGLSRIGGQVNTDGTFSQTYGYFEVRAQLPADPGYLGAIWMMPVDQSGTYAELDIAEVVSDSPTTLVNSVWGPNITSQWENVANTSQGFHTYAVDWEPNTITWYFDGQQVYQAATPSNMNKPMYMILSNQSGTSGSWGGGPASGDSSQMLVDYVRAYDANPYTSGGALTFQSSNSGSTTSSSPTSGASSSTNSASAAASTDSSTASGGGSSSNNGSTGSSNNSASTSNTSNSSNPSGNIVDIASGQSQISAASGSDVFVFDGSGHQTRISDFSPGVDKLDFEMTSDDFSNVSIGTSSRGWAVVNFDGNRISLPGVTPSQLSQGDFLFNTGAQ